MAVFSEMLSVALIEKDTNNDVLWTWSYPSINNEQRDILCKKCCLQTGENTTVVEFLFSRFQNMWYYIMTTDADGSALDKIKYFSLILVTKDFNPEKYLTLSRILSKLYKKSGNPAVILEAYLSVVTKGRCNGEENGAFTLKEFDVRKAYISGSIIDVIDRFQIETILIYTAILLKKRVAVYHSIIEELLQFTRILPALVWHRQNWNILHPYVHLDSKELQDLTSTSHYVAGFVQPEVENRSDLYDLFVNISTLEISVAPHAKEALAMGKIHKELAMFMLQCSEDNKSEQQTIKDLSVKTKELISNLQSLSTVEETGVQYITLESLKQRKMQPVNENFLFNLASAEGMVKT